MRFLTGLAARGPFVLPASVRGFTAVVCLVSAVFVAASEAATERPNVIVIYADDQGVGDLGVYGAEDLHTPHLDALAASGVRFTQMYAPSAVCSPSRAGLLTGRYPQHVDLAGNASEPPETGIDDGHSGRGLSSRYATMASVMREGGYATALIGKWHLGYDADNRPEAHGFDHWFGHLGGCIDNFSHFNYWGGPNRHDLWRNGERVRQPGSYFPDLMVEEARRFMTDHREEPFFIYYAVNTPHYPYQPDPEWLERYDEEGVPYPRNLFAAFVSTQDERIGRLLAILDELELREETIVIFQSDHGYSREARAHFGGGSAGIYRGAKFSLFEGGIRVPSIVSWPAGIPAGEVRDQMVHGIDWLPTLAEFCGIDLQALSLDGKSLAAVIESAEAESPHEVLHWGLGEQWVVRRGPWKLYGKPRDPERMNTLSEEDRELFLIHLDDDPAERNNLVAEYPQRVRELLALRLPWQR